MTHECGHFIKRTTPSILDFHESIIFSFYQSFHFLLIKLATRAAPNIIVQELNREWHIPKVMKEQFKRPKAVARRREKRVKKGKSRKSSKSSKKSKTKGKTKKDKSDKTSKTTKRKGDKTTMSKAEKAELTRQKKLQEKLEEEFRKIEENKRSIFPLSDAATDSMFQNIFENWKKPKQRDRKKKEKKGEKHKK